MGVLTGVSERFEQPAEKLFNNLARLVGGAAPTDRLLARGHSMNQRHRSPPSFLRGAALDDRGNGFKPKLANRSGAKDGLRIGRSGSNRLEVLALPRQSETWQFGHCSGQRPVCQVRVVLGRDSCIGVAEELADG